MTHVASDKIQQLWGYRRIRKMKHTPSSLLEEYAKGDSPKIKEPQRSDVPRSECTARTVHRLWLRSPWNDYSLIGPNKREPFVASRIDSYFQTATIRSFPNSGGIKLLQTLSTVGHPNIAKVYDVYCCDNKIYTASEYLEISLTNAEFQSYPFEQWEAATIVAEVLKGLTYLLSKGLSCKELKMSNVRLSIDGRVKIVLELEQYGRKGSGESLRLTHALLDMPCMAEIVEEILLIRHDLNDDEDTLGFISCCLSGSIDSLVKHPFLEQARPAHKLASRVRFAVEASRSKSLELEDELGVSLEGSDTTSIASSASL